MEQRIVVSMYRPGNGLGSLTEVVTCIDKKDMREVLVLAQKHPATKVLALDDSDIYLCESIGTVVLACDNIGIDFTNTNHWIKLLDSTEYRKCWESTDKEMRRLPHHRSGF